MLKILIKAAKEAGKVHLKYFQKDSTFRCKGNFQDLLTKADKDSQKVVHKSLSESMLRKGYKKEDFGFIGEEDLNVPGKLRFVFDPLDGTANFSSGYDHFCVSIALFENKKILAGVIHHPAKKSFYVAERGKGAYKFIGKKKRKLKITYKKLEECLVISYFTKVAELRKRLLDICFNLYPNVRGIRALDSAALDLACFCENVFNIVLGPKVNVWDIAAANLIVSESGGVLVNWKGEEIDYDLNTPMKMYPFVASHPKNIKYLLKMLHG